MNKPKWKEMYYTYTGTGTCPVCGEIKGGLQLIHFGRCSDCLAPIILAKFEVIWQEAIEGKLTQEQLLDRIAKLKAEVDRRAECC